MIAEFVGLLTIVFSVVIFRADKRGWIRKLSLFAIAIVIAQGVLGGITVLYFLPWYISSAHAALGQTFFAVLVLMAVYTGREWIEGHHSSLVVDDTVPSTRFLALLSICAVYLQLFFGAGFRHSGISILPHLVNAVFVTGILLWTAIRVLSRYGHVRQLRVPAIGLIHLLMLQLALGLASYITRVVWGKDAVQPLPSMVSTTVAHVAIGALLLATAFVLEEQLRRLTSRAPIMINEEVSRGKAISA
jgi:heme A synthase